MLILDTAMRERWAILRVEERGKVKIEAPGVMSFKGMWHSRHSTATACPKERKVERMLVRMRVIDLIPRS